MKVKKWIISIILILIITAAGISIKVYLTAMEPVKAAESKAVSIAKKEIDLRKVHNFSIYNGLEQINVIEGENKQGEQIVVWIPEKSKKVFFEKANNGLSKEQAIQKLNDEINPKEIISVRLGMEKNTPLWEIYYRSNNNLINYYYIHFTTGEWLKKIENL